MIFRFSSAESVVTGPVNNGNRMREKVSEGVQGFDSALGAAGQVQN